MRAQRKEVGYLLDEAPSLRTRLSEPKWLDMVWAKAIAQAASETGLDNLPESCPWPMSDVLADGTLTGDQSHLSVSLQPAPPMRIALWQCVQIPCDVAGNLARLRQAAADAVAGGADLLVTPEMALTGYAIGAEAAAHLAEAADGPSARQVGAIAAAIGIAIVWGFPELDLTTGTIYNAAQFVDETGVARATYRKTHLYGALDRAQFSASDEAPGDAIVDWRGWRIGLLICYDVEFPETVRALALAGADLVLVPTANMVGYDAVALTLVPARAFENGVFVAYANCCGREADLHYGGLSVVAGPDAQLRARAGRRPTLVFADIDPAESAPRRAAVLADRRPTLYSGLTA